MSRSTILSALLVALASLVLAACSAEQRDQVAQTLDKINTSIGINSTLSEMQSLDPRRAAAMLSDVAEVKAAGSDTIGGVEVTRYSAEVDLEQMVEALSKGGDAERFKQMLGDDAKMTMEVAIDGGDRIRGFAMNGAMGPMTIDADAVVSAYSRDLTVKIPTQGVYDATAAVVGALAGPDGP